LNVYHFTGAPGGLEATASRRAQELMERVGLQWTFALRYPPSCPRAQQRVGLCRAMISSRLYLPTNFRRPGSVTRNEIQQEFLQLQAMEPRTIVLVTHDLHSVRLAQRLLVVTAASPTWIGRRDCKWRRTSSFAVLPNNNSGVMADLVPSHWRLAPGAVESVHTAVFLALPSRLLAPPPERAMSSVCSKIRGTRCG